MLRSAICMCAEASQRNSIKSPLIALWCPPPASQHRRSNDDRKCGNEERRALNCAKSGPLLDSGLGRPANVAASARTAAAAIADARTAATDARRTAGGASTRGHSRDPDVWGDRRRGTRRRVRTSCMMLCLLLTSAHKLTATCAARGVANLCSLVPECERIEPALRKPHLAHSPHSLICLAALCMSAIHVATQPQPLECRPWQELKVRTVARRLGHAALGLRQSDTQGRGMTRVCLQVCRAASIVAAHERQQVFVAVGARVEHALHWLLHQFV